MSEEAPNAKPNVDQVRTVGSKAAPKATRFLFAGYTALALAAVVLSWQKAPGTLVPVAIGIIVLSTVVVLLVRAVPNSSTVAGNTLLWIMLSSIIVMELLFISSAFFGVPERGGVILARLLNSPDLALTSQSSGTIVIDANSSRWPSDAEQVLDIPGDRFDRVNALSHRPSVTIRGASVVSASAIIAVNILDLQNGTIVTNGSDVTIEAVKVLSSRGSIRSFEAPPAQPPSHPGPSGGRVTLVVYDKIVGRLNIDLAGSSGGAGNPGKVGAAGANGGPGENSSQGLFGCNHGGGSGGTGLPGGHGGDGEAGAPGGDGGTLAIQAKDPDVILRSISFTAKAGAGGPGGPGGQGGSGGRGGPGGHGGGYCGGGQGGPDGPPGEPGHQGPAGSSGTDGPQPVLQNLEKS
jgi:hypothetical protein